MYLVQRLQCDPVVKEANSPEKKKPMAYSEIRAAFPNTVSNTQIYRVVPHTHCPATQPCTRIRSSQKMIAEKMYKICVHVHQLRPDSSGREDITDQRVIESIGDVLPEDSDVELEK